MAQLHGTVTMMVAIVGLGGTVVVALAGVLAPQACVTGVVEVQGAATAAT
jgi:hypothetical protein